MMKKYFFLITLFICSVHSLLAQRADTAFIYTFGGNNNERFYDIKEAPNNTYILAGYIASFGLGSTDVYILKIDSVGKRIWSKTLGGSNIDIGYSVTPTYDNGFAIAGYTNGFGIGGYDIYLIKTDSLGNIEWTKTYGGTDWDFGYSIVQASDSGFIICGETYSAGSGDADALVIKTDKDGNTIFQKTYGGLDEDIAYDIIITKDNKYAFVGSTVSFGQGQLDIYLNKIDNNGDIIWSKTFGDSLDNVGYSLVQTLDSGYVIAGYLQFIDTVNVKEKDIYNMKTDSAGNFLWQHNLGNQPEDDEAKHVVELPTGELFFTGYTGNGAGESDVFAYIALSDGSWTNRSASYGAANNDIVFANMYSPSHQFLMAGYTNSPTWSNGHDDGLVMILDSIKPDPIQFVQKFNDSTVFVRELYDLNKNIVVYPNPFNKSTTIYFSQGINLADMHIDLFNAMGESIGFQETITGNSVSITGDFSRGIYLLRCYSNKSQAVTTAKLIVE